MYGKVPESVTEFIYLSLVWVRDLGVNSFVLFDVFKRLVHQTAVTPHVTYNKQGVRVLTREYNQYGNNNNNDDAKVCRLLPS